MGGQSPVHEKGSPVRTLGPPMLVAIDTSTVTDFVNDHPGEAYGVAAAVVLLLILFLLVRRRNSTDAEDTGAAPRQLSGKDARRAKKEEKQMVRADAKAAREKARAESKQAKVDA